MKRTLRFRMLMTLAPMLIVVAMVGGVGLALLSGFANQTDALLAENATSVRYLGERIDLILRENYDSVVYMVKLQEALERIDYSFQFALAGQEEKARTQFALNWQALQKQLELEQGNVTLPGEGDLVKKLSAASATYRTRGLAFFDRAGDPARRADYDGTPDGLHEQAQAIKAISSQIMHINQENMEQAGKHTAATARASLSEMEQANRQIRAAFTSSLAGFAIGLAVATFLVILIGLQTVRRLLQPIRSLTESAIAIGAGNLDQVVPIFAADEIGQLAAAFNTMARQLREYRHSEKTQMLRIQQTSQATVNAFPHPVLVVDPQGKVTIANPAARRVLGVLPDSGDLAGRVPWQPPGPLAQPLAAALRDQRDYLPAGFGQTFVLGTAGDEQTFLPRILVIRDQDGHTLGAAILLEDVTRFRLLDQIKSNLVATVSHELKTPLTGIRLAVHILLQENLGPLSPKQIELLLDARENTERLLCTIDNLLDLAKLESTAGGLALQPYSPADLVQNAVGSFWHRAEDKGVHLDVQAPADLPSIAVEGSGEQITHALQNLLDNALRYTDSGGSIRVSARAVDGKVELEVADTGKGIPGEYLPHVFERFFRVPGQSQEGGTGLGLAIVREAVAALGGTVSCMSIPNQGTRFVLTLPAL
jgi:two-component system, NtrC family, sensor histidine kinase KinB